MFGLFVRLVLSTFFLFCSYVTLVLSALSFLFVCYISSNRAVVYRSLSFLFVSVLLSYVGCNRALFFLLVCYISTRRALSYLFVAYVSCNRPLSFLFVCHFSCKYVLLFRSFFLFIVSALWLNVLKFDHEHRHFEFCLETWLLTCELRGHTF